MNISQEEIQKEVQAQLEHFVRIWAPEDQALRDQFFSELHILHAKIFMAAQAPFLRMCADAFARQPVAPVVVATPTQHCDGCSQPIFGDSFVVGGRRYGDCCFHKTHTGGV